MSLSLAQLVIILLIVLVLFGAGRVANIMGELGKGLKLFRNHLRDDDQKFNSKGDQVTQKDVEDVNPK